ncbi:ModE family transcriptional regulator [Arcobacter sp. LA11]|uniref:ModE family transcriptional regulator n=1 Tax=Arcobacter sp. LA11 TaxID=1898176 RepID=UPI0009352E56|nr:ModE family transcriptional regulator [Arcobacter sp. LA11]
MAKLNKDIQLDETQKELILTNLDDDGKLSCLKAFKVAHLIGIKSTDMIDACESIGIKISNCELGFFDKIKFENAKTAVYNKISQNFTQNKDISCKTLWYISKQSSFRQVGNSIKHSDIETIRCQLGCFHKRKEHDEIKN